MPDIDVVTLAGRLNEDEPPLVLDVRQPWEIALATISGSLCIPMNEIPGRLDELRTRVAGGRTLAVLCHAGVRSAQVADFLERAGFDPVLNVAGGIDAWSLKVDPNVPRY